MKVTEVRIRRIPDQTRLRAIASITFDECFVVHDIKVIEGDRGLFVAMPSRRNRLGFFKDLAHPIVTQTRVDIEKAILDAYRDIQEENK